MKWFVGNIKLALMHPPTDKAAKWQLAVWSLLLLVVLMSLTMAPLLGTVSGFTVGFCLVGLIIYTVCLRWSILGMQYRARERRLAADREAFDAMVKGL